ncbi:S8 family peptidase [Robiginitalea sp. SC105]|uniref:S8 family peptidase n=1 Tax=Robiginitalea sp. SC105 TaxID=2762332 RepID=UPI0016397594|nr:S8 family peptidase [Robiginitalea sp. SC105]MBC2838181.1 S8 family serine peptidase [Robiginitalea sp. SC105]
MKQLNELMRPVGILGAGLLLWGCGSTRLVSTPVENIDSVVPKVTELTEVQSKHWSHADLVRDSIPGMSVDRAYEEVLGSLKGQTVVVAVLDSGIDLDHEDLDGVLWTNQDERPGNGVDDDNNGYVDDIHGYNFLGESYNEQLEAARILRLKLGDASLQERARKKLEAEKAETAANKQRYEQILEAVKNADAAVKAHLGKDSYAQADVQGIQTQDPQLAQAVSILKQMYNFEDSIDAVMDQLQEGISYFSERLDYHFNTAFNGREIVGDDPYDIDDRGYGNGNPGNRVDDESHGTHVAGIIAAERGNGIGVDGVADQVRIMAVRAVPNGDEYDKDIALGIRYAVDNGASIINASFGKPFSPRAEWVYDAIKYAAEKDVLIVHAAGNDSEDLDLPENTNYPTDQMGNDPEFADNVLTVGSLDSQYGSEMVSSFSNYGKSHVDVFAPGGDIYSTMPGNTYEFQGGTSMAAPAVAGIAAVIRSRFPRLSASQVKKIIMQSGLAVKSSVILGGNPENARPFASASRSGKIANLYNALILASQVDRGVAQP